MSKRKNVPDGNGVDCDLDEEAKYLESEFNNAMHGKYTLVANYASTSEVDKELVKVTSF